MKVPHDHCPNEAMRGSLLMMKLVAQGERDLARGKSVPQTLVFRALRKRLTSK